MYIQDGERLSSIEEAATAATLYDQQGGHWTDKAAKERGGRMGNDRSILYPWVRKSISILYT